MYQKIRNNRHLNTFVILTRFLIGFAFIPSGLRKILGERFTQLGTDTPVGFFFEGLYQTGFYWIFLGIGQFVAAFLLMTQRFATLGALIFFFIITNIWVITLSMNFTGTWIITSLMMLATLMLLAWDYHKLKYLFVLDNFSTPTSIKNYPSYNNIWVIAGFVLFSWSVGGLLVLEKLKTPNMLLSMLWLLGLFLITLSALILNEYKYRKVRKIPA